MASGILRLSRELLVEIFKYTLSTSDTILQAPTYTRPAARCPELAALKETCRYLHNVYLARQHELDLLALDSALTYGNTNQLRLVMMGEEWRGEMRRVWKDGEYCKIIDLESVKALVARVETESITPEGVRKIVRTDQAVGELEHYPGYSRGWSCMKTPTKPDFVKTSKLEEYFWRWLHFETDEARKLLVNLAGKYFLTGEMPPGRSLHSRGWAEDHHSMDEWREQVSSMSKLPIMDMIGAPHDSKIRNPHMKLYSTLEEIVWSKQVHR